MNLKTIFYYLAFISTLAVGIASILLLSFDVYFQLLGGSGGFISATAIFIILIRNLPSFQKGISPLLSSLNFIKQAELASIAYNIQGNLNEFRDAVNEESPDLVPEAEVEWVSTSDKKSFFDKYKGKVIVRMKPSKENPENLARAVMVQVSKGVIPESRLYIDEKTSQSIDLVLAKKILTKQKQHSALRYYANEILNPELTDKVVLSRVGALDSVDERGHLTRLYLREIAELPKKHGLRLKGLAGIRKETLDLLKFLEVIAERERGQKVPLTFKGKFLRTAIIMVSEEQKFSREGVTPYAIAAVIEAEEGSDIIYVIASGEKVTNALDVIDFLNKKLKWELVEGTTRLYEDPIEGRERKAICAVLKARAKV